jgi:hypothetical protein
MPRAAGCSPSDHHPRASIPRGSRRPMHRPAPSPPRPGDRPRRRGTIASARSDTHAAPRSQQPRDVLTTSAQNLRCIASFPERVNVAGTTPPLAAPWAAANAICSYCSNPGRVALKQRGRHPTRSSLAQHAREVTPPRRSIATAQQGAVETSTWGVSSPTRAREAQRSTMLHPEKFGCARPGRGYG